MSEVITVPAPTELARTTMCGPCERRVIGQNEQLARATAGPTILPEEDFCRWCARPISERAERLADNAGFLRFAQMVLGDRRPAPPTGPAA